MIRFRQTDWRPGELVFVFLMANIYLPGFAVAYMGWQPLQAFMLALFLFSFIPLWVYTANKTIPQPAKAWLIRNIRKLRK